MESNNSTSKTIYECMKDIKKSDGKTYFNDGDYYIKSEVKQFTKVADEKGVESYQEIKDFSELFLIDNYGNDYSIAPFLLQYFIKRS